MIFKITGWPLDQSYHIDRQRHLVYADLKEPLGTVKPIEDSGYEVYLDASILKWGDDIVLDLIAKGRELICDQLQKNKAACWLDELGKVRL